jgi:uncharacterized protein YjbI with pentapeptide repeats
MPTEFINETPFKFVALPGRVGFPGHSLTMVAKATFRLKPNGTAVLAEEQDEYSGDLPFEDDESGEGAPKYEADLIAPTKPNTDFIVVGSCHAPGGQPLKQCQVSVAIGSLVHHLNVFGKRQWLPDGRITAPEPFSSMPLRYERSYGGPGFPENPSGVGFAPVVGADGRSVHALPNIEDPRTPVTRPGFHPFPAGFGALPRGWRLRASKLGTYGNDYLKTRWPGLPLDFDFTHFNAAHPALQVQPYAKGAETLVFVNMHPQHARYETKLPNICVRGFLDIPIGDAIALREVPMHLDTVWADVEAEKLVLVWRGVVKVSSAKYPEVRRAYLVSESLDAAPRSVGDHEVLLSRRLVEMAMEAEPPNDRMAALAAAMAAGSGAGFGSTAALPTRATPPAAASNDTEDEDDAEMEAQLNELSAALAAAGAMMPKDLPETPDVEIEADEPPLTPEQRVAAAKAAVAQGKGLANEDLSGLDFSGFNFRAACLDDALLVGTTLVSAKLDGCSCKGATFAKAQMADVSAQKADFSEAQMPGVDAPKANFSGAKFVNSSLEGANFQGAALPNANLHSAVLTEANVAGADFTSANLDKANFNAANAANANFTGASMANANFAGCNAQKARFADCKAAGIRAAEADFSESTWQRALAPEAVFSEAKFDRANLSGSVMPGANFIEASLVGALLLAAELKGAKFSEAKLTTANFAQSNLFEAVFEAADLSNASLRNCNAYGAEFLDAKLQNCDLAGANLKRSKLAQGTVQS